MIGAGKFNIGILKTGSYLPSTTVSNEALARRSYVVNDGLDSNGNLTYKYGGVQRPVTADGIYETSGIKSRRLAGSDDTLSAMVVNAFNETGFDKSDLGGIVCATSSSMTSFPSVSSKVHSELDLDNNVGTFDVYDACSGYLAALTAAYGQVLFSQKPVLVAGVERLSDIADFEERSCTLFGDGCGVAIIGPVDPEFGFLSQASATDSSGLSYLFQSADRKLRMPYGGKVMERAVRGMLKVTKDALTKTGKYSLSDLKCIIPHQANQRIIDGIAKRVRRSECKTYIATNIENTGNMSTATIPVALDNELRQGRIDKGDLIGLASMGAGLSFRALILKV